MATTISGRVFLKLDDANRLVIPSRWRSYFADGASVTQGRDRCLRVYPLTEFDRRAEEIYATAEDSQAGDEYVRQFFSNADPQTPDASNRLRIHGDHVKWAGLDKEVWAVGAGRYFEIWDRAAYEAHIGFTPAAAATPGKGV